MRAIFPNVPVLALTATAPQSTIDAIIRGMQLEEVRVISVSPNRPNIYYQKSLRLSKSSGTASYEKILRPIATDLKVQRLHYPLTVIYLDLQYCGYAYRLFETVLGEEQYAFMNNKVPGHRLFGQYNFPQTGLTKSETLGNLKTLHSFVRVIFATSSLGMGVDAPEITNIVHIKPPKSLEEYLQMTGRAGRSGAPAKATLYYCNGDISDNIHHVDDHMKLYCSNEDICL